MTWPTVVMEVVVVDLTIVNAGLLTAGMLGRRRRGRQLGAAGRRGARHGCGVLDVPAVDVGAGDGVVTGADGDGAGVEQVAGQVDGTDLGVGDGDRGDGDVAGVCDRERVRHDLADRGDAGRRRVFDDRQRRGAIAGDVDFVGRDRCDRGAARRCCGDGGGVGDAAAVHVGLGDGVGAGAVHRGARFEAGGRARDTGRAGVGHGDRAHRDVAGVGDQERVRDRLTDRRQLGGGRRLEDRHRTDLGIGMSDGLDCSGGIGGPVGGVPVTEAVLRTWPAFMSACVTVSAAGAGRGDTGSERECRQKIPVASGSVTVIAVIDTLPMLVTVNVYGTTSPTARMAVVVDGLHDRQVRVLGTRDLDRVAGGGRRERVAAGWGADDRRRVRHGAGVEVGLGDRVDRRAGRGFAGGECRHGARTSRSCPDRRRRSSRS